MAANEGLGSEGHFRLPKAILKEFQSDPRVIMKLYPAGLWPIPPEFLKNPEFMKTLANDAEFNKNYTVIVTANR